MGLSLVYVSIPPRQFQKSGFSCPSGINVALNLKNKITSVESLSVKKMSFRPQMNLYDHFLLTGRGLMDKKGFCSKVAIYN